MIVLDTTVLVYAKGNEHPLRNPARDLIQAISDQSIEATTTPEVIQEFVHVRASRRGRGDAANLGRDFAELLSPLISVEAGHLEKGLSIFAAPDAPGAFDSVLAAVAIEAGAVLVSADQAFGKVQGLDHTIPDREGVNKLLGA